MTKQEFIKELKFALRRCEFAEVERLIDYYEEIIMESMERGLSEAEAIARLDSIETIARNVEKDNTHRQKRQRFEQAVNVGREQPTPRNFGKVVILSLTLPITLPLMIAFWAVMFALVVSVFSGLLGVAATCLGLVVGGLAAVVAGVVLGVISGQIMVTLAYIGIGLLVLVLGLWLFRFVYAASRAIIGWGIAATRGVVRLFTGKKTVTREANDNESNQEA